MSPALGRPTRGESPTQRSGDRLRSMRLYAMSVEAGTSGKQPRRLRAMAVRCVGGEETGRSNYTLKRPGGTQQLCSLVV
jgi:hypothetical protein